jgi:hypothetical protein
MICDCVVIDSSGSAMHTQHNAAALMLASSTTAAGPMLCTHTATVTTITQPVRVPSVFCMLLSSSHRIIITCADTPLRSNYALQHVH